MIKCVDEDSNEKGDNAMVSHNKEEEEGGAGMPNWLKRCQQQISAHKIYERPNAMCTIYNIHQYSTTNISSILA